MGEEEAERGAGQRWHQAFDQQLPPQRPAPGPERRPYLQLVAAPQRPCQRQVGDIGAGDDQDEAGNAEQQVEGRPGARGELVVQHGCGDGVALGGSVGLGILIVEPPFDLFDLGTRLLERGTGGEAREPLGHAMDPVGLHRRPSGAARTSSRPERWKTRGPSGWQGASCRSRRARATPPRQARAALVADGPASSQQSAVSSLNARRSSALVRSPIAYAVVTPAPLQKMSS